MFVGKHTIVFIIPSNGKKIKPYDKKVVSAVRKGSVLTADSRLIFPPEIFPDFFAENFSEFLHKMQIICYNIREHIRVGLPGLRWVQKTL